MAIDEVMNDEIYKKILIRTPNWLGDSVMGIPAVKAIKNVFPDAELWVYTQSFLEGLWRLVPEVTGILKVEDGLSPIRNKNFDLAVLLTNSFHSALDIFRAGIPQRMGYKRNMRGLLLTNPVFLQAGWEKMHQIDYFLALMKRWDVRVISNVPKVDIPVTLLKKAKVILSGYGWNGTDEVVGIHATASYGSAKCWPPERFGQLINKLGETYNPWIVLVGSQTEEKDIEKILKEISGTNKIINLCGKTDISELTAVINMCKVFISNDSGPMHLAGAVGVPVAAIFGSTDPKHTGPRGRAVIVRKDVSCSPCFERVCKKNLECMYGVEASDVMNAVKGFLL